MNKNVDFSGFKIVESDNDLSQFARALALPVRISILRVLIEEGCWISHDVFTQIPFSPVARESHLQALIKLGIVKTKLYNRNKYYHINDDIFQKMAFSFQGLFDFYRQKTVQHASENL